MSGATLRLEKEWETTLGPLASGFYLYRAGVCPGGSVFFSDHKARLALVTPEGTISYDRLRSALAGATAVACDDAERPYVAVSGPEGAYLFALNDLRGNFTVRWKSQKLSDAIFAIAPAGDSTYVLSPQPQQTGDMPFLHHVRPDGTLTNSFGALPTSVPLQAARRALETGSLIWSPATKQIIFMSSGSIDVQYYSPDGTLQGVRRRPETDFAPFTANELRLRPRDTLRAAAQFATGEILLFVTKERDQSTRSYLEILRPTSDGFVVVATDIFISEDGGYGHLFGVDRNGFLYFARGRDRKAASIIKARLVSS